MITSAVSAVIGQFSFGLEFETNREVVSKYEILFSRTSS